MEPLNYIPYGVHNNDRKTAETISSAECSKCALLFYYRVTACDATHSIAKVFLSVRLSVGQVRALDKTKRNLGPHS